MTCGSASRRSRTALLLGLTGLAGLLAAAPLRAQQVLELGPQLTGTASDPVLGVGGMYAGMRISSRIRLAATAGVGAVGETGDAAGRGELLAHFLLNPRERRGAGLYGGGGVAGVGGPVDRGYIVLLVGVESRPGAAAGWAVEAGIGGGARVSVGWRWRWGRGIRRRRSRRSSRRGPATAP